MESFSVGIAMSCFMVGWLVYSFISANTQVLAAKEDKPKETVKTVEAKIKEVEVVGSYNVDYNTYFELGDGTIMRLENDKVYTYAKFNIDKPVKITVVDGTIETEAKGVTGEVIYDEDTDTTKVKNKENNKQKKVKVYKDSYKYISDVIVGEKSIRS